MYLTDSLTYIVQRDFSALAPASQRHSPRDPRQPGLQLPYFRQLLPIAQHPQERLLGGVFGVVMVAERSVGDSVNQPRMFPNREFQFVFVGSRRRKGWAHHPLSYHSRLLKHEDRLMAALVHKSFWGTSGSDVIA